MQFDQVQWAEFKAFVDSRSLNVQFRETSDLYFLKSADAWFGLECNLSKADNASEVSEFEADYKADGNKSIKAEVTTQFEKRDKTVKLASAQANVGNDSLVTILIKSPGTPGTAEGRWISGGIAWFDDSHKDDRILSVEFTDEDNILGYGAGTVVGSYTDSEAPAEQQGWRIPIKRGVIEVEALGGYGFAPAGLYLKLVGKKGGSLTTGTLYINIEWGKQE